MSAEELGHGEDHEQSRSHCALDRCPVCNYSLRGLPAAHRCPECGFQYDRHTRVWRARGFWRFSGWVAVVAFACMIMTLQNLKTTSPQTLIFWWVILIAALWACMGIWNIRLWLRKPFLAVTPSGVVFRLWSRKSRNIPWDEMGQVHIDLGGKGVTGVYLSTGRSRIPVDLDAFVRGPGEPYELKWAVMKGKRTYGHLGSVVDAPGDSVNVG
jgi:hypothetical protein